MSDRRRIYRDNSSSSSLEPVIIERKPKRESLSPARRRRVSFSLNPFKRRRNTVVIKESTVRRRKSERRSRTPSPSPSPTRGPDHAMDPRIGTEYVPLPKKLPQKDDRSSSSEEDRSQRSRRRPKIIQEAHPEDPYAYPVVESPPSSRSPKSRDSPRRRDSGIYSIESSPRTPYYDTLGRLTYGPSPTAQQVQNLTNQLHDLQVEKNEAKKDALRAREDAVEAKEELLREKRRSLIEKRERDASDKEKQQREQHKRISDIPAPLPREVVLHQDRRYDPGTEAHNRAKEDFKKKRGGGFRD